MSESINPWVAYIHCNFCKSKSTNNSWRYEGKCEWVFFLNTVYIAPYEGPHINIESGIRIAGECCCCIATCGDNNNDICQTSASHIAVLIRHCRLFECKLIRRQSWHINEIRWQSAFHTFYEPHGTRSCYRQVVQNDWLSCTKYSVTQLIHNIT